MKIRTGAHAAFGLALLFAVSASAGDVSGKWTSEFETQVGPQKYVFELKAQDGKVTGKATFERMGTKGEAELKDGKVSGDDVSFVEMLDFQGQAIPITYTGKLSGDEIKFTRNVGDFAKEEIVAKRVKP